MANRFESYAKTLIEKESEIAESYGFKKQESLEVLLSSTFAAGVAFLFNEMLMAGMDIHDIQSIYEEAQEFLRKEREKITSLKTHHRMGFC